MIQKGSEEYKKAQYNAWHLKRLSSSNRWNDHSSYSGDQELLYKFCRKIEELDCFAAKVAKTVENSIEPFACTAARMSDKQCWILAVAAVENEIEIYE